MNNAEDQYLEIMKDILENGTVQKDRSGAGTKKVFGRSIRHDFKNGFPLLTTKKMHTKSIIGELLWFLMGTDDPKFLKDNGITIWDEWIDDHGKLPHTYGVKWRDFGAPQKKSWVAPIKGVDQISNVIESIKTNPFSRRHIVSAWDPCRIKDAALPWCHIMFQFNVREDSEEYIDDRLGEKRKKYLDISVLQRSADWILGVPFNLASYGFLLHMIAAQTGTIPGEMYYTFGDSHIYLPHMIQADKLIHRIPYKCPQLNLNNQVGDIDSYQIEDFTITNYKHHPRIKASVIV